MVRHNTVTAYRQSVESCDPEKSAGALDGDPKPFARSLAPRVLANNLRDFAFSSALLWPTAERAQRSKERRVDGEMIEVPLDLHGCVDCYEWSRERAALSF